jgi:energy-coupling factor transport system permease protein
MSHDKAIRVSARAVAAWSAACLLIALLTTNPVYKGAVLAAALGALAAGAGLRRIRGLLIAVTLVASFAALLNFASAHLGETVLVSLPPTLPGIGGPYTLEALAFGATGGLTIAAAILAVAPFSLLLESHDIVDAMPQALTRSGAVIAASLNLVPEVGATFAQVSEAQRMRGWRPRGPRSWAEVIVPVVLTSVESSLQLAESMEARGFGSGPRTHVTPPQMSSGDWIVTASAATAVVLFVVASAAGWAQGWAAYPVLTAPPLDPRALLACALLFTPVAAWRSRR